MAQIDTHQAVPPASPQDSPPTPKVSCSCWHLDSHYTPILSVADPLLSSYTPMSCLLLIQQLQTTSGLYKPWTSLLSSTEPHLLQWHLNPFQISPPWVLSQSPTILYKVSLLSYSFNSLVILIILDTKLSFFNQLYGFHLLPEWYKKKRNKDATTWMNLKIIMLSGKSNSFLKGHTTNPIF